MAELFASISQTAQILLAVAVIWVAGFLMTRVTKLFGLPNVTGYILAGVAIGPYALHLIPDGITAGMEFMTDVALSFIAFGVGRYLRLDIIGSQGKQVFILTLMEALVAALVVTLTMRFLFGLSWSFSLLLGAIGSATAPASSLMTIRQYRAKGEFVNTLIQVVAMDDAVALLAFSVCSAIASGSRAGGWQEALAPLWINAIVLFVSYLLGRLLCTMLHQRSAEHRLVLTCACIFTIAAGCAALNVSPLLGCMMLGATYINVTGDKTLYKQVNRITPPINVMFFVLSGMRLNLDALATVGLVGIVYFLVRIGGKMLGAYLGARMTGMAENIQRYLGLTLIPQAGVSIGLAVLASRILPPQTGSLLSTIILSSSVLYEMIGPVCAKKGLVLAGAISPEALAQGPFPEPQPVAVSAKKKAAPKKPEKPEKAEKGVKAEKSPKTQKTERSEKQEKPDRAEKTEKPEKAEKPEKPEKHSKQGKQKKPEKAEKTEAPQPQPEAPPPEETQAEQNRRHMRLRSGGLFTR